MIIGKQEADMRTSCLLQYIQEGNFDSKLFRVVSCEKDNLMLNKMLKEWDDSKWLYIKNKKITKKTKLEEKMYYQTKLKFAEFTPEDKVITYIKKAKFVLTDHKPRYVVDSSDSETS